MLTYLSYIALPKEEAVPTIKVLSKVDDCVAFRCNTELKQGPQRVRLRTARNWVSVEVDIYNHDQSKGLYEGRINSRTVEPYKPVELNEQPKVRSLYGHLQEKFASGATVRCDHPLTKDAYLKVELEGKEGRADIKLGRILWVQQVKDGKFDVRVDFTDKQKLKKLSKEKYYAVS